MMKHPTIADRAGVSLAELNQLLAGNVSTGIAARLGVTPADVSSLINGRPSNAMTDRLGVATPAAAADLAQSAGQAGAIGIVLGLLISN